MFTCFPPNTAQFFLTLRFNNYVTYFNEHKSDYIRDVQTPFYGFITQMAPFMLTIDPGMEVRPYKCLARIRRDTRFTKDKSPYKDHLWVLFRRAAEPREQSVAYWFELGATGVNWGLGFWGENRNVMDAMRRRMVARPDDYLRLLRSTDLSSHHLYLAGEDWKKLKAPDGLPVSLLPLYMKKTPYFITETMDEKIAEQPDLLDRVKNDYAALAPFYRTFRGLMEDTTEGA